LGLLYLEVCRVAGSSQPLKRKLLKIDLNFAYLPLISADLRLGSGGGVIRFHRGLAARAI